MLCIVLCVLLVAAVGSAHDVDEHKASTMTARCRAHCLSKFNIEGLSENCFDNSDCWMCWDTCHLFYTNFEVWGPMCHENQLCFAGCQESCNFYYSHTDDSRPAISPKNFTQPLKYRVEGDTIRFEWSTPEGASSDSDEPLVYVLTMHDQFGGYSQQVIQTFYRNATVRRGLLKSSIVIRLAAYTLNGKIAQTETGVYEFGFVSHIGTFDTDFRPNGNHVGDDTEGRYHEEESSSFDYIDYYSWCPALIALRYSIKERGGVDAQLSWPHLSHKDNVEYEVEWKSVEQNTDVSRSLLTQRNAAIITLRPDNVYDLVLRAFTPGPHRPVAKSKVLRIDTTSHTPTPQSMPRNCSQCLPMRASLAVLAVCTIVVLAIILLISAYAQKRCID